jgi:NADH-quinone oxidoreductase subunit I
VTAVDGRQIRTGHGAIRLIEPACTSCMICARECPTWCIEIDSHREPIPDLPSGARQRTRNALDRFRIDWSLCMFCGICVEECPYDALEWTNALVVPADRIRDLAQEKDLLGRPDAGAGRYHPAATGAVRRAAGS